MEYGKTVGDSFEYAKEGLVGKWAKWILLIISCIIFPLMMGYVMRIYRGVVPSPQLDEWGRMFVDGIKLFIVAIIYAIPILIVEFAVIGSAGVAFFTTLGIPTYILALIVLLLITGIIELICWVIPYVGWVLLIILLPFIGIFSARYITLLYESAGEAA